METLYTDDKKTSICKELSELLGVPSERLAAESNGEFVDGLVNLCVDALVRYGKDRKQILKVSDLSTLLCQKMALGQRYCQVLQKASLVYDIGNLKIDPAIYSKAQRLSFDEFEIIKYHTIIGHDALRAQNDPILDMGALVAAEHHEWYDGSGYPYGLRGEEISISARIVALADTAVALASPRSGREVVSFEEIVAHIEKRRSLHFDPHLVDLFIEHQEEIREILEA